MEFKQAKIRTVKANLATKTITLSFEVPMNDEQRDTAERLGVYAGKDAGKLDLTIVPVQPALFPTPEREKEGEE